MKVYAARTESMTPKEEEELTALLDADRRARVHTISNDAERSRSIYAGLLLRYAYLMEGYSGFEAARIGIGAHGKPYIEGCADFCYSLSHSGEWVLCAADTEEIGVDIQWMRPYREGVAKRFFHKTEYERIMEQKDGQSRRIEFYSMWTAKEACAKLTGLGIGAGMGRYVTDSSYRWVTSPAGVFYLKLYRAIPDYTAALCSKREAFPAEPELVAIDRLVTKEAADGKR